MVPNWLRVGRYVERGRSVTPQPGFSNHSPAGAAPVSGGTVHPLDLAGLVRRSLGNPASSQAATCPVKVPNRRTRWLWGRTWQNTFPIHSSSLHCKNLNTNASVPCTSCTPTTSTLPGVQDIDGPRAVRHSPEVDPMASEYSF